MRIVFLNCYSGQILSPLLEFLKKQSLSTDIFCFSEVSGNLQKKFTEVLKNFSYVFELGGLITDCNELCGQTIFVKKGINIINSDKISIHEIKTNDVGFLLKTVLVINKTTISIGNIHGTSAPADKKDTEERLKQSKIIIDSFNIDTNKIIVGDFNLSNDTQSVKLFENAGYKNLIKDFEVKSTRNEVSWNRFKNEPGFFKQYYADYCFVSSNIKVKSFEVPYNEVSDHLPLILEFEI